MHNFIHHTLYIVYNLYKMLDFYINFGYSINRKRRERSINAVASSFFFYTFMAKIFYWKLKNIVYQGPGIQYENEKEKEEQ